MALSVLRERLCSVKTGKHLLCKTKNMHTCAGKNHVAKATAVRTQFFHSSAIFKTHFHQKAITEIS